MKENTFKKIELKIVKPKLRKNSLYLGYPQKVIIIKIKMKLVISILIA